MKGRRKIIAVVGDARLSSNSVKGRIAEEVGRLLVDAGFRVLTGGLGGVMEAACKGARKSKRYREGDTIGILPSNDPASANRFVDVAIPTGLDLGRGLLVAQSSAMIAIGGGAGTLSEIAMAWALKRLIVALRVDGWSGKLADQRVDGRIRYKNLPQDRVYGADTAEEAVGMVGRMLRFYKPQCSVITLRRSRDR